MSDSDERHIPRWLVLPLIIGGIWATNAIVYGLTGINLVLLALEGVSEIDG